MRALQPETKNHSTWAHKTAALLEVLGIFIAGNFAAGYVSTWIGVRPIAPAFASALQSPDSDFLPLAIAFLQNVLVQYACLLLPTFAIGWWRRRLRPRDYGLTTAGKPVLKLIAIGLIAFALVAMPVKLLWVTKRFVDLGQGSPFWALLDKQWTPSFWLCMAVASFALVPILEELFYRGYCQTRLEEDFGSPGAIVIMSLFMSLGHSQYHHLTALSIGTILSLISLTLGLGYVYWRTRSLIPAIFLHAAVNVPTKGIFDFLVPITMIVVLILFRQKWLVMAREFCQLAAVNGWKKAALAATLLAVAAAIGFEAWPNVFVPLGCLAVAVALLVDFHQRRLSRLPTSVDL